LKELEDYSWFPPVLRNFQTEFIGFIVARFNVYGVFIDHIKTLRRPPQSMTDLCSGSGEPAISIFKNSKCFSHLILSDKYPNTANLHGDKIYYEKSKVDVLEMEFRPGTCYTMFNAFHHFTDEEKLKIAQKIQNSGSDAFIVEILQPNIFCFLKILFATTIGSLFLTPFIRPFSIRRLLLTYILPVNTIAIAFDGILSVAKSRSAKQYQNLFYQSVHAIQVYELKSNLSQLVVIQIEGKK
jgi:ubiquinone/menaquinone biosynthesis C-methylase UbiE